MHPCLEKKRGGKPAHYTPGLLRERATGTSALNIQQTVFLQVGERPQRGTVLATIRHTGQRHVTVFVARQLRCIPCSSAAGTCAPRGTSASVPRHGSNTPPSGRRSHEDSCPADRAQPSRGRCQSCSPRGSSGHSCRPPGRPSALQTDVHVRMS